MNVASGRGEQEVDVASGSGWNIWVWLLGAVVRRYIDFLILLIPPYSSCICSFLQQHPYFLVIFLSIGMSEILHRRNSLQTLEYLALGTLSRILITTIVFYD